MSAAPASRSVKVPARGAQLAGDFTVPPGAGGIVVFAHGSGSSRLSPRNRSVAGVLHERGLATLLFDLLTREEDSVYETRFDIPLLTERLCDAVNWLGGLPEASNRKIGLFGASTGAAAALQAAAALGGTVAAVVSRGGRPDLAGRKALQAVAAPTLLIVGEWDDVVIDLNKAAMEVMRCPYELKIIPGATHLFEEPGTLEQAAAAAADWFARYLTQMAR